MNKPNLWVGACVFAASVVVTVTFWKVVPARYLVNESTDYTVYYEPVARNLLDKRGFTLSDGTLAIRYPPGFPSLLALAFGFSSVTKIPESVALSMLTLTAMGSASVLIYMLAQSVCGQLPGLVAALVWIFNPFALWLTKQPNSELSFLVVFYAGIYVFWHALRTKSQTWHNYFFSGLLFGFASLIRPIAMGAAFILGGTLLLLATQIKIRLRLFLVTLMLVGNFVAIFPWEIWVYHHTGRIIPLSTGGFPSIREGLTYAVDLDGYRLTSKIPEDVTALMQDIHTRRSESVEDIISLLIQQLKERPQAVTKLFIMKAARSWYGTDSGRYETATMLLQIIYLLFALWGSVVSWRQGGMARNLAVVIWVMVFYFWGMTILVLSILRYMVPAMGLLALMIPASFFQAAGFGGTRAGSRLFCLRPPFLHGSKDTSFLIILQAINKFLFCAQQVTKSFREPLPDQPLIPLAEVLGRNDLHTN